MALNPKKPIIPQLRRAKPSTLADARQAASMFARVLVNNKAFQTLRPQLIAAASGSDLAAVNETLRSALISVGCLAQTIWSEPAKASAPAQTSVTLKSPTVKTVPLREYVARRVQQAADSHNESIEIPTASDSELLAAYKLMPLSQERLDFASAHYTALMRAAVAEAERTNAH